MEILGNTLWFIFGGFICAMAWVIVGACLCLTIIGIPCGLQCFKFAQLTLWPFGKEIVYGGGAGSTLANIIWIIVFGIWMALLHLIIGALWCCTIVGAPFGLQFFKLAKLSLTPFGARVVSSV